MVLVVGRDAIETYENQVRQAFPCCPLCGSKKLMAKLISGGKDTLSCESCKAQWHLIIGISGLKWAELEHAPENGEGKVYLGKRYEKGQWQKLAEKLMKANITTPTAREVNQIVREKEIIREKEVIVKIRCPYCKNLYNEILDKCPNCGGHS